MDKVGQIPIINILFGIAALFICLFHFIYSTINYVKDQLVLDIDYYGQFGVALFFVLLAVYFKSGHIEAVIGGITILTSQFFNSYSSKTLNFFGNISYSLYLLHPLVGVATINVLSHTFFLSWQKPFVVLIGLLAALVSSYITYISIEKRPQLLSKRLTYK